MSWVYNSRMSERSELSPKAKEIINAVLETARAGLNLKNPIPSLEAIREALPNLGPDPEVVRYIQELHKNRDRIDFRPGEI